MPAIAHLKALQALEAVVRTGSFRAAAAELAVTPAAVGQRIKSLEDYLGLDLLARGRSGIRPTPELDAARAHLTAAFREIGTVSEILDMQRGHEIHVVADSDWATLWLAPRLPKFRKLVPNVRFCINGIGDVPVRLGHADCAVHFDRPDGGEGEIVLFRDWLLPVGSPAIVRRIARLPAAQRLEGFPLLHLDCYRDDPNAIDWPVWVERFGRRATAPGRGIRYRRLVHALESVYANAGLLIGGLALVQDDLARGRLALPYPARQGAWTGHAYCARFAPGALRRRQLALFRDWLAGEAARTAAKIAKMTKG